LQLFLAEIQGNLFELHTDEVNHCVRVLRKSVGDVIQFITGDGNLYEGSIVTITKKSVSGTWTKVQDQFGDVGYDLTVAIAPTKNMDRIEAFVEKAVEMGITRIVPIICDHSERKIVKTSRLKKIALSATKQSLKGALVQIDEPQSFDEFIRQPHENLCIAHCETDTSKTPLKHLLIPNSATTIMIGPEGDFSKSEILRATKAGAKPVHLGSSRLRTETAGLVAVAVVYDTLGK